MMLIATQIEQQEQQRLTQIQSSSSSFSASYSEFQLKKTSTSTQLPSNQKDPCNLSQKENCKKDENVISLQQFTILQNKCQALERHVNHLNKRLAAQTKEGASNPLEQPICNGAEILSSQFRALQESKNSELQRELDQLRKEINNKNQIEKENKEMREQLKILQENEQKLHTADKEMILDVVDKPISFQPTKNIPMEIIPQFPFIQSWEDNPNLFFEHLLKKFLDLSPQEKENPEVCLQIHKVFNKCLRKYYKEMHKEVTTIEKSFKKKVSRYKSNMNYLKAYTENLNAKKNIPHKFTQKLAASNEKIKIEIPRFMKCSKQYFNEFWPLRRILITILTTLSRNSFKMLEVIVMHKAPSETDGEDELGSYSLLQIIEKIINDIIVPSNRFSEYIGFIEAVVDFLKTFSSVYGKFNMDAIEEAEIAIEAIFTGTMIMSRDHTLILLDLLDFLINISNVYDDRLLTRLCANYLPITTLKGLSRSIPVELDDTVCNLQVFFYYLEKIYPDYDRTDDIETIFNVTKKINNLTLKMFNSPSLNLINRSRCTKKSCECFYELFSAFIRFNAQVVNQRHLFDGNGLKVKEEIQNFLMIASTFIPQYGDAKFRKLKDLNKEINIMFSLVMRGKKNRDF